ncbi:rRNA processing protein [Salix suchowensis]|nr:rRNA processing protein [Salix suchowensis]
MENQPCPMGMKDGEIDDLDKEVSESESELEDEYVKSREPSKNAIFNRESLADKLQDINWPENVGWIHKFVIDIDQDQDQDQEVDVNDDHARELAFYTQLESKGIPFLRPPDYYAVVVKSDGHMEMVKSRLLAEKRSIEEAKERRKETKWDFRFGFGFGGKNGLKKQNTADTTDDLRGFNKGSAQGNKKRKRS